MGSFRGVAVVDTSIGAFAGRAVHEQCHAWRPTAPWPRPARRLTGPTRSPRPQHPHSQEFLQPRQSRSPCRALLRRLDDKVVVRRVGRQRFPFLCSHPLQMLKIEPDLLSAKDAPDLRHKSRQLARELGPPNRRFRIGHQRSLGFRINWAARASISRFSRWTVPRRSSWPWPWTLSFPKSRGGHSRASPRISRDPMLQSRPSKLPVGGAGLRSSAQAK